jgi:hypothetical protein
VRFINTKAHALIDYILGLILVFLPWGFRFENEKTATFIMVTCGVFISLLAMFTKFEYSVFQVIDLLTHYRLDLAAGIFLAVSPWIFGFSAEVFKPHLVFGLTHLVIAALSDRVLYKVYKRYDKKTYRKQEQH